MAEWLSRLALRFPGATFALLAVATAALAAGALRLESESYLAGTLPADDPELVRYRALETEFGSDHILLLVLACGADRPCATIFEPEVLALVRELSEHALRHRGVVEVTSLSTVGVLVGDGGALHAERLGASDDAAAVARFRALVEDDPVVRGTIVARDERATAVVVRFDPRSRDAERNGPARELLADATSLSAAVGFDLKISGDVAFAAVTEGYVLEDLAMLTPVMLVVLALILLWVFREPRAVWLGLTVVTIPVIWAFGLMGWAGSPVTPITSMMPVLLLVVGITDVVHFLVRTREIGRAHETMHEVVQAVAREVGPPTTVTAFTSALGFLSFLAGPLPPVRAFGVVSALGIMGAWLLTFTLLPAALGRGPMRRGATVLPAFALGDRVLDGVRELARRRWKIVLLATGIATVASVVGAGLLVVDTDTMKLIGQGDPLAQSERFIRERLRPTGSVEVMAAAPEGAPITDPEMLRKLERVETVLVEQGRGTPAVSVLPVLRVAGRELGETARLDLPGDRAAASQLLLLAEAADADATHRVVTSDARLARVSGAYVWGDGKQIRADLAQLRAQVGEILGSEANWSITGSAFLAAHLGDLVLRNQVASFATAFLSIFLTLLLFVRSIPLGVLGMIPNLLPVVVTLGFMGFAGINLDVGTAMIASIVLGISVDDTIYFLVHYQQARARGATVGDAVSFTFAIAGKPALFCAGMLGIGFFVLGFSTFQSLAIFGLLSGATVLIAAASELFVLPALLVAFTRSEREP